MGFVGLNTLDNSASSALEEKVLEAYKHYLSEMDTILEARVQRAANRGR